MKRRKEGKEVRGGEGRRSVKAENAKTIRKPRKSEEESEDDTITSCFKRSACLPACW